MVNILPDVLFLDDQLSLDAELRGVFCSSRRLWEAGKGAPPSNLIAAAYFEAGMAGGKPDIEVMKLKVLERWPSTGRGGASWALVCIDMSWGVEYPEFGAEVFLALRSDPRLAGLPIAMLSDRQPADTERVVRSAIVDAAKGREWSTPTCLRKQDTDAERPFLKRLCIDGLVQDDAPFILSSAGKGPLVSGTAGSSRALLSSLREMRRALADRKEGGLIIVHGEEGCASEDLVSYANVMWDRTFELHASPQQYEIRANNIKRSKLRDGKADTISRAASLKVLPAKRDDELGSIQTFDRLHDYNDEQWELVVGEVGRHVRAGACVVVSIVTDEPQGKARYNELVDRYDAAPVAWPAVREREGDASQVFRRCSGGDENVGVSAEALAFIDGTDWRNLAALKKAGVGAFKEIGRRNRYFLDLPDVRDAIEQAERTQERTVSFEELLEILRNFRFRRGQGDVGWEEVWGAWPKFRRAAAAVVDSMYAVAAEHPKAKRPKRKLNVRQHAKIMDLDAEDTGDAYRRAKGIREFLGTESKLINDLADKAK